MLQRFLSEFLIDLVLYKFRKSSQIPSYNISRSAHVYGVRRRYRGILKVIFFVIVSVFVFDLYLLINKWARPQLHINHKEDTNVN